MSIISNAAVISNLSRIGSLDLLRQLYGEVFLSCTAPKPLRGVDMSLDFIVDHDVTIPKQTRSVECINQVDCSNLLRVEGQGKRPWHFEHA